MNNQATANPLRNSLFRFWPWLIVLMVLLFVGFIRVRVLDMPLERDEGEYAYAGQLILQGIPPYELVYNMKLPGTYFAYALGMAIFGETARGVHLTLLAVNSLTIVLVFLLGRKLFRVTAGLVACASFGVMSVSPAVLGMAAHATQFVVLFAVPGALVLWNALASKERRVIFFSGLLFGLAFLMKQPGVCFGLFGVVVLLWQACRNKSVFTREFGVTALAYGAGFILPLAFFCLTVAVAGDFRRFWFWTFDYASIYATGRSFSEGIRFLDKYIHEEFDVYVGFWILAGAGLVVAAASRQLRREIIFALAFLIFSFFGTTPGFYFRYHYFVLLLPSFAIIVGMAVTFFQSGLSPRMRIIPLLMVCGLLGWTCHVQTWAFFRLPPQQLCRVIYQGNPFLESQPVAQYIREHSKPDTRIAVIGSEPQIYFYSGRHSVTGYIYTYALIEKQPYAVTMQHEMINEVEAGKPEFIVLVVNKYSWLMDASSDMTIIRWIKDYTSRLYEPVGTIGEKLDGQSVWVSGKAGNDIQSSLQQFMTIYRRKPDAN